MLRHTSEKYPGSRITLVCRNYSASLFEACPYVDEIIGIDHEATLKNNDVRVGVIWRLRSLGADACLYSSYSRESLGDFLTLNSGAKETIAMDGDNCNLPPALKSMHDPYYTRLISSPGKWKPEAARYVDFLRGMDIAVERNAYGRQIDSRVVGHSILRVSPSAMVTVGRLTWKS
jgi:ADP-heptose:LPS heptosyltransferase